MTINRRQLFQSMASVLAALGWKKSPTVGHQERPTIRHIIEISEKYRGKDCIFNPGAVTEGDLD